MLHAWHIIVGTLVILGVIAVLVWIIDEWYHRKYLWKKTKS